MAVSQWSEKTPNVSYNNNESHFFQSIHLLQAVVKILFCKRYHSFISGFEPYEFIVSSFACCFVKPHKLVLNANFWYDHVLTYYRLYFVIASKVIPDTMHSHTMTANIYDILRQGNLYPGKISPLKFVPVEYYLRYDVGKRVNMIDMIMFVAILFYKKS